MKRFIIILLLAGCSSATKTTVSAQAPLSAKIEVQGHRGARGVKPENSLVAFDYALQAGVDVLELDLAVTKDNELVVSHEPLINAEQCLDSKGKKIKDKIPIRMLSLAEVKTFSCGTLPHPRFPKQQKIKVPYATLREVFELVKNSKWPAASNVQFNIETKSYPGFPEATPNAHDFASLVLKLVNEYGLLSRMTLQSFDHRTLVEAKKIEPKTRLSPLFEENLPNLVLIAKDLNAEIVSPNQNWITKSEVDALHQAGVRVIPWTANEEKEWDRLISLNVDGIISDYPDALIEYLKKKGLR